MVNRPDTIAGFHEQDWLIVVEALMYWAEAQDEDGVVGSPRKEQALELAACIADQHGVPIGEVYDQIDENWSGTPGFHTADASD